VSRAETFLWIALPYLAIATFVVGHVWRYRRGQLTWTARSTQLLEHRLLRPGSLMFHFGLLAVIGGHVLGILIPQGWTEAIGISESTYHLIASIAGITAGVVMTAGLAILIFRRAAVPRVRATTSRSDLVMYVIFVLAVVTGMVATIKGTAIDGYNYRETVSPWFRGIFAFDPNATLMTTAPFIFQIHAVSTFLLFAVWPFTRLVHAWSVPFSYLTRSPIVYRSRRPHGRRPGERAA